MKYVFTLLIVLAVTALLAAQPTINRFVKVVVTSTATDAVTIGGGVATPYFSITPGGTIRMGSFGATLSTITAPSVTSGFGSGPSVSSGVGTMVFKLTVGSGGSDSSGVIGFPVNQTGWRVSCDDTTTKTSTVFVTKQTGVSTASATMGNFNTSGAAAAWVAGDVLVCNALGF